jgi:hypothetical protein
MPEFNEYQFIPTKFTSARQKARFANQFVKFVSRGFQIKDFPHWFYVELSNTFGHIAHYDRIGFYRTFFLRVENKIKFLNITLKNGGYGDPSFTHSDVEKVLAKWVSDTGLLEKYMRVYREGVEAAEKAELVRLKDKYEKYGIPKGYGSLT